MGDSTKELQDAAQDLAKGLGIELSFDADADLAKFRRGRRLTMGELRQLPNGTIVWLYIWHKESCRADSAYRLERTSSGDCWMLDDGSSFAADLEDVGDDSDLAGDEWSEVYEAVSRAPQ